MTNYLNPSTRSGGAEHIVVADRPPAVEVQEAPFDDTEYVRVNGEWSQVTEAGMVPDTLAPSPPTGLSTTGTIVTGGGAVDYELTWVAPTTNVDATPLVDLAYYVVRWRYGTMGSWASFVSNDTSAIIHGLSPAVDFEWEVLARDTSGNDSTWTGDTVEGLADTVGPEKPSLPILTSRLGTISVRWDGLDHAGDPPPPDFDHLEFYMAATSGGPWTYLGRASGADLMLVTAFEVGDTRFFTFVAVDTSGNVSPRSSEASIVVQGILSPDIDTSVFDSIDSDIAASLTAAELDAQEKADLAQAAAIAAASADATTKANNAQTAAATDATTKANNAQTAAITAAATDAATKADVAANLINNVSKSGNTLRWSLAAGGSGTFTVENVDFFGVTVKAGRIRTSGNDMWMTDAIKVDQNKVYEVSMWVRRDDPGPTLTGRYLLGLYAYPAGSSSPMGVTPVTSSTGTVAADNANHYMRVGTSALPTPGTWERVVCYIAPYGTTPADLLRAGITATAHTILPANADSFVVRVLNYDNAGTARDVWVLHPTVSPVSIDFVRNRGLTEAWRTAGQTTIDGGKITTDSITTIQLAANAVEADNVKAGAIIAGKLAADSVLATNIKAGEVVAGKLAADSVATLNLQAGAITATKIGASAVEAGKIAANAVQAGNIEANAITTNKLAAGAVDAVAIATDAVTATKIQAGAVTATKIQAGAVTADKLSANAIDGKTITGATIRTAATGTRWELGAADAASLLAYTDDPSETDPAAIWVDYDGPTGGNTGANTIIRGSVLEDGAGVDFAEIRLMRGPTRKTSISLDADEVAVAGNFLADLSGGLRQLITSFSSGWALRTGGYEFVVTRVGNGLCLINGSTQTATSQASGSIILAAGALPTWARPSVERNIAIASGVSSPSLVPVIAVRPDGGLRFYNGSTGAGQSQAIFGVYPL